MFTQSQLGLLSNGESLRLGHNAKFIVDRVMYAEMYRCRLDDGYGEEKIIAIVFPETMSEDMFFWLINSAAKHHKIPVVKGNF